MPSRPFTWPNHERMAFGSMSIWISFVDTFEQIIDYSKSYKHIWLARRDDVAAWARKYYEKR